MTTAQVNRLIASANRFRTTIRECGMSDSEYDSAVSWFRERGISCGPKRDRAGRFHGEFTWLGVPTLPGWPTVVTCTCGPMAMVDMLRQPESTLLQFGKSI